jgi:hypothetical protein
MKNEERRIKNEKAPPGFEPGVADLQSANDATQPVANYDTSENDSERLAFCLALLARKSPDLARVIDAWPMLPAALRAGILAMIDVTRTEG